MGCGYKSDRSVDGAVVEWDPQAWSPFTRAIYAIGGLYLLGFFAFFAIFRAADKRARTGDPMAVARYNRLLRGFPNAFYAKLLGRRRLEPAEPDSRSL